MNRSPISLFEHLETRPVDPIFGLHAQFVADPRQDKINLTLGVLIEEDGNAPRVWNVVKEAEKNLLVTESTKDYLSVDGDSRFTEATTRLILGDVFYEQNMERIYTAQTPGGTAAIRIILEVLQNNLSNTLAVSTPTWANHITIANYMKMDLRFYPYYNKETHQIDFEALCQFLTHLRPRTTVLLQASAHNPTGVDLSMEQWQVLSDLFHRHSLIPFFDTAYQGLGKGLDEDTAPIRLFVTEGHECFIASSYSKNCSLYSERVGGVTVIARNKLFKPAVASQIKAAIRANYSNPPRHGGSIVAEIMHSPRLKQEWKEELQGMLARVTAARNALADTFTAKSGSSAFEYIKSTRGMFFMLNLSMEQVVILREKYGLYMTGGGRVNAIGANAMNREQIVESILSVL